MSLPKLEVKRLLHRLKEALDADILNSPQANPPAIVFRVDHPGQSRNQGSPSFSTAFVNYVKKAENGIRSGFRDGKWHPITDHNGRFKIIAYGHKILPGEDFSKGISESQAHELLMRDLLISWQKADKWLKAKYQRGLNSIPRKSQEMLVDFAFNPGSLGTFPKFVDAVIKGDLENMRKEYKRSFVDASGIRREMGRNELFADLFLNGTS